MADPRANRRGRVEIRGLAKSYDGSVALRGVDLDVAPGEFVSLLGPSGCGKTTLLRCIAGLVEVDRGEISVDGRSLLAVSPWKRDISVVFQSYALFPHMNVADNVGFGLRMRQATRAEIARRVEQALGLVHMSAFAGRFPSQLSGGQQQRVALARAIVVEPTVLLLDEPLAALDAKLRGSVQIEIRALQRRLGVTTILVTHDQAEAMTMSDRVAVMEGGRIEQVATPLDVYARPATPFVADFVGEINRLPGEMTADGRFAFSGGGPVAVSPGAAGIAPGPATLMVRPENVRIDPDTPHAASGGLRGLVETVVLNGDRYAVFVRAGALLIRGTILNTGGAVVPNPGDAVFVFWRPEDTMVFAGIV